MDYWEIKVLIFIVKISCDRTVYFSNSRSFNFVIKVKINFVLLFVLIFFNLKSF